jgi:DNA-directed RNA polymerase subunit M/transcription elongation factor TFIIS
LRFECKRCSIKYPSEPEDTLRYENKKNNQMDTVIHFLKDAHKDPTNLRAYIDCPKCGFHIAVQVDVNLTLYNICESEECGNIWVYI